MKIQILMLILAAVGALGPVASASAAAGTADPPAVLTLDAALRTAEARYTAGDIDLGGLLPVRRDWATLQMEHLESLRDVMQAWADLSPFLAGP